MMRRPSAPLFLSRRFYRRRRLRDAARLLPVFGMFFLVLPMLWTGPDGQGRDTARDAVYFFWIWIALLIFAMVFSAGLATEETSDGDNDGESDGDRVDDH